MLLLIGTGNPHEWAQPEGATLLSTSSLALLELSDYAPPPSMLDPFVRLMVGSLPRLQWPLPERTPMLALALMVLLLLTEAFIVLLVYSELCFMPERASACAAVLSVLPAAGLLAPLAGLLLIGSTLNTLHGVSLHRESSLSAVASGALIAKLRQCALWNAASLPNAIVAQLYIMPYAMLESTAWQAAQHWLLPLSLIVVKLLQAQTLKVLNAATGLHRAMLITLRRWVHS